MTKPFPSLLIKAHGLIPQGAFAEAQAQFLKPDLASVTALDALLQAHNIGVVAHFYMDVELQGILSTCKWRNIYIADSLLMADKAVKMAEDGVGSIIVLGVDFMSENVRAVLDAAGHEKIPVYRVSTKEIGCSLAESAEARAYGAWLNKASQTENALHVIYINTSLQVKAHSHLAVPTITCTSSNVLQTILQAAAEIPNLNIWYGPDTYMGANLAKMFRQFSKLTDSEIAAIHPAHNRQTIEKLQQHFHFFKQGNCFVHHMFGEDVVAKVRQQYPDAFHTAHLEVPGEMFALAVEAQQKGMGVVGSTSNILNFIGERVEEQSKLSQGARLRFVLGTEAGMITSIVRKVQSFLQQKNRPDIEVEIIFPVATEAVATDNEFGIVPGVAGGEGCSTAGGCATCPYMKMNSLDALFDVVEKIGDGEHFGLLPFHPRQYTEKIGGRTAADLGGEPILFMRHFQREQEMPPKLVKMVTTPTN